VFANSDRLEVALFEPLPKQNIETLKTKLHSSLALTTIGWLAFATGAIAGFTSYFDQPTWLAAAGTTNSLTVFSFQGPTELNGKFANDPTIVPSYASQGVVFLPFTGTTVYPVIARGQQFQISAPDHDGLLANSSSPNPTSDLEGRAIRFDFNIPVRSVGVNFNRPLLGGDYGYLEAFDSFGNLIGQTPVCVAGGFVGLVSDTPVTEVHVVNTGNADISFGIWNLQFVSAFGSSCVAPPSGLVSWWPGDGTARDLAGGINGTLTGGVTFTNGQVGQAFRLDGNSGWVDVSHSDSLNPTGPFSIECWINASSQQFFPQSLVVDKSHGFTDGTGWGIQTTPDGKAGFFYGIGGPSGLTNWFPYVATSNSILDNQWHYLAGVWTGTQLQIYEDGMLENTLDQSATPANNSRDVEIGGAWGGSTPTRFFHGMIDEVTYYSRALTAAEIQSIYAAGSLGKCKPPQMLPQFSGTGFNFGFQSVSNQSYTIQRNDDLTTTNWIFFTNFTGDGSLLQLVAPVTNAPQRYFRLRQP
jgi:hypothetical protein